MKRPAFQVYPADWRKDTALQACSPVARGLWWELMCVMHECRPYGHLTVNANPATEAQAAAMVHYPIATYRKALAELEAAGVPSRTPEGILFSRRMVRDERLRNTRAAFGKLGGNPNLVGGKDNHTHNLAPNHTDNHHPNHDANLKPTPSSSSSKTLTQVGESPTVPSPEPRKSTHSGASSPSKSNNGAWWKTPQGIEAEAKTERVTAQPGETHDALKARVFAAKAEHRRA